MKYTQQQIDKFRAIIVDGSPKNPETGCWEWRKGRSSGYGSIRISEGLFGAHRLSHIAFIGPIPDGMFVCHKCDNRKCTNPDHLFTGTAKDNVRDMIAKGRNNNGKRPSGLTYRRPLAHLDDPIKELHDSGMSMRAVARKFGISHQVVSRVVKS